MQSVALIDYGSGNLRSAEKALRRAAETHELSVDIIVTADGSGVLIRASGRGDPEAARVLVGDVNIVYSQWNGGAGMGWALDMAEKVRPCLKPATAPAPWDKLLGSSAETLVAKGP